MTKRTVEDVMTTKVITAGPETSLRELARLMYEHEISGIPVVDDEGRLAGIVTEADLLKVEKREAKGRPRRRAFLHWVLQPDRLTEIERRSDGVRAADIMTTDVVTATPTTPVREAVRTLLDAGVKRLPVVEDERIVGIASRHDLLSQFLRDDEEIREEIVDRVVLGAMWIDPEAVEVDVEGGVVRLSGHVGLRSEKEILVEMVRGVDGVVDVVDDLTFERDDRDIEPPPPRPVPRLRRPFSGREPSG